MDDDTLYIPKPKRTPSRQKVAGIFGAPTRQASDSNAGIPHEFLRKVQFMEKYTDPLKKYIRDCFAQCSSDRSKELVSNRLIEKINTLSISGGLYNYAWESEPLVSPHEAPPPPPEPKASPVKPPPTAHRQQQQQIPPGWGPAPGQFVPPPPPPMGGQWAPPQYPPQYPKQWPLQPGQFQPWQQFQQEPTGQFAPGQPMYGQAPVYSQDPRQPPVYSQDPRQAPVYSQDPPAHFAPGQPMYGQQPQPPKISSNWQAPQPAPLLSEHPKPAKKEKKDKKEKKAKWQIPQEEPRPQPQVSLEELVHEKQIVGTSTKLEKEYVRLTGDTDLDPKDFRPLPILKKSLDFCLEKFAQNKSYEYISEQLRSIRQDLTVQHISDPFCVRVYETHARLAIEHEDWDNFNQSMNPLESLCSQGYGEFEQMCEIGCYRVLYLLGVDDLTGLFTFILRMKPEVRESEKVQFAISVWKAACSGEWVQFFNLMKKAEPMCAKVMSIKAKAMRSSALVAVAKAYRRQTLADYRTLLFLDTDDEVREYLKDTNVKIPDE